MAPKPKLLDATMGQKKRAPLNPATARGMIAKAQARRDSTKNVPREAPATSAKPSKPRSFPPPSEQEQERPAKKRIYSSRPDTARQQIRKANAAARARDPSKAPKKDETTVGGKRVKVKPPGLVSQLKGQDATSKKFSREGERSDVLNGRTRRAQKWMYENPDRGVTGADSPEIGGDHEVFRLMDLPNEVRARIWDFVVVETAFFIWPERPNGREQPDLAMVNKEVRAEVLPIFYGLNTFGIELAPIIKCTLKRRREDGRRISGLSAITKWAKDFDQGGVYWFGHIRHWAFDLKDDGSLVVTVSFHMREDKTWDGNIEIHRMAACTLPGRPEYKKCSIKLTPDWANEALIAVLDAAKRSTIGPGMIVGMAEMMKSRANKLVDWRCEKLISSTEH